MKAIRNILAILVIALTIGCSDTELSPQDYAKTIVAEDSGHRVKKEIGDYIFEVLYTPIDLLALKEYGEGITKEELNQKRKDLEQTTQFILRINLAKQTGDFMGFGITSKEDYSDKVSYFSFGFQKDIYLEQGGNRLPCQMYHFERTYGIQSGRSFTIGFIGVDTDKPFKLIIDSPTLNTGPVKMNFPNPNIFSLRI